LTKPVDEGGLGWGTLGGSVALLALLIGLIIYQTIQVRRHPLEPVPFPVSRLTGQPQLPNGQVIKQTTSSNGFDNADQSPATHSKVNRLNQASPGAAGAGSGE
jgi:hypothetical protein